VSPGPSIPEGGCYLPIAAGRAGRVDRVAVGTVVATGLEEQHLAGMHPAAGPGHSAVEAGVRPNSLAAEVVGDAHNHRAGDCGLPNIRRDHPVVPAEVVSHSGRPAEAAVKRIGSVVGTVSNHPAGPAGPAGGSLAVAGCSRSSGRPLHHSSLSLTWRDLRIPRT
jgi:hypothetical protein